LASSAVDVTVVIPTRARWQLLAASALPAALSQKGLGVEVLVVDDGSPAPAPPELAGLDDRRVRVLRHERPLGVARARNAGVEAALGEWVAFLDDDDLWSPRKLRTQLDAAAQCGAGFAYTAAVAVDDQRRPLLEFPLAPSDGLAVRLLRWNELHAGGSNVVVQTELLRRLGGFDEQLFQLADWDLWIRLALESPAAAVPEPLVGYTMHAGSMLLTDPRDVFPEFDHLVEKHRSAAERLGAAPDARRFSRWVAQGQRRAGLRRQAAGTYLHGALRHRDAGALPRAVAALLGERAFRFGRSVTEHARSSPPARAPDWLVGFPSPTV